MFLNLHPRSVKKGQFNPNQPRQKSNFSSLDNTNKSKSYTTLTLKQQFKEFKHKSLSRNSDFQSVLCFNNCLKPRIQDATYLGQKKKFNQNNLCSFLRNTSKNLPNLKITDFKQTYLNLDSKLIKSAKPKDYFKPLLQNQFFRQPDNNQIVPPSCVGLQTQNEEENARISFALAHEVQQLRREKQLLQTQNQELRNQKFVDLELIARQNQVIKKQEQLIQASREAIHLKNLNDFNNQITADSSALNYQKKIEKSNHFNDECQKCIKKQKQHQVEDEFLELKLEKIEEEKRLLKKQIYNLVFRCQKYKEALKKTEKKYETEQQQNRKLLSIISNSQKSSNFQNNYLKGKLGIDCQPYLNQKYSEELKEQNDSVTLKKKKQERNYPYSEYHQTDKIKNTSNGQSHTQKHFNPKSASDLIKYNSNYQECQKGCRVRKTNEIQAQKKTEELHQLQSLEWCQNENIKRYLKEINKQKIKEIDRIELLLVNQ